ncbi:MAG: MoaD family protein [Desulfurococcaceae archaeon]|jgi:MoaD family protein|nr:MoaD family protein [Desulfurococcaceae archaeon]
MKVRFFGILRDFAGVESVDVVLGGSVKVKELLNLLSSKLSWFNDFLKNVEKANISIIILVNDHLVNEEYLLNEGDEVTLLPPAAGG